MVSDSQLEQVTSGQLVVNAAVGYDADIWVINAGVNNLFDTEYADYLDGYNRVMDSNIQFNQHMPAMGMGD